MDNQATVSNKTLFIVGLMSVLFAWLAHQSGLLLLWIEDEEYGHGLMVIGVLAYLLYRNRSTLLSSPVSFRWLGVIISLLALLMFALGEASGIAPVRMYSVWLFAVGATFSIGGWGLFKKLLVPLFIILLLIPLPNVLGPLLTAQLQLISSTLGVWFIRLFGGVVFLEGNVIDMGGVQLLVAEACAGLRYLFPLMSIGAIAAYLMRAPLWMRWAVFLATIPITIFMNSFRIAVTGLLVESYGMSHTEGFLHFFEGWVVFIACLLVLLAFTWVLIKLVPGQQTFSDVFSFDKLASKTSSREVSSHRGWQTKPAVLVTMTSLVVATLISTPLITRENTEVVSKPLSTFPQVLGEWEANEYRLPQSVEVAAGASDYYYGNFMSPANDAVNLYISYYQDQKQGAAPHSPTLCIPGDGWVIESDEALTLTAKNGQSIDVSRLLITKGEQKMIAYYWLKQGDKAFRYQYKARLDLIRFSILDNRADAALIRMITDVREGEEVHEADARLQQVASELLEVLPDYVPD